MKYNVNKVQLNEFSIGGDELVLLAGPCVIEEDLGLMFKTAEKLQEMTAKLKIPYVFKSSFDKANRSSLESYRGVGREKGLEILAKIKEQFELPITTDIHHPEDAKIVAEVVDILQIPAFLCRQTDLLVAAAQTGKIVNIKKGQFLAPQQVGDCGKKVVGSGNSNVLITERGVTFGYGNLVSDMRAIPLIQCLGYPVIFDATHSVQLPGGAGEVSSGQRQFVGTLAKAAVAAGANGLFMEVHPDPDHAPCDALCMLALDNAYDLLHICKDIFDMV